MTSSCPPQGTNTISCNTNGPYGLGPFWILLGKPAQILRSVGLGSSPFARHYLGNDYYFLFLRLLRCFSSPGLPAQLKVELPLSSREGVSPFGNLRVKGCLPPHRSLSQAATSFIVFLCQGIRHTLLLRFSHAFILKLQKRVY